MNEEKTDPDKTPPEGLEARDELPTSPDLALVTCPECRGQKSTLVTWWEGSVHRGRTSRCEACRATGTMSRHEFTEWHARRMGRPHQE